MQNPTRTIHSLDRFEEFYNKKVTKLVNSYRMYHVFTYVSVILSAVLITIHLSVKSFVEPDATGFLQMLYSHNRTILHTSSAIAITSIFIFANALLLNRKVLKSLEGKIVVENLLLYAIEQHFSEATVDTKPVRVLAIKSSKPLTDTDDVLVTSYIHTNKENVEAKHLMKKVDDRRFAIEFVEAEKIKSKLLNHTKSKADKS